MNATRTYDAVVVGSGPNGLAAAVTMARAGRSVIVYEAQGVPGGGARSSELTLPGFTHDICSAVHPLAVTSPFFTRLPLEKHGLEWIFPPRPLAHPLGQGEVAWLENSIESTAANLAEDEKRYRRLIEPLVRQWEDLFSEILRPIIHWPKHPILLARFGAKAMLPAETFARHFFRGDRARALFAGVAAHVNCPLNRAGTAAIGLTLILAAHARGWPIPKGGSQSITNALIGYLKSLGGEIEVNREISSLDQLPKSRWVFFDLVPSRLVGIFNQGSSSDISRRFEDFRHGAGIFKIDWALKGAIPWLAKETMHAGTIHLGGSLQDLVRAERMPEINQHSDRPFVLLCQPSLFDPTRAPPGKHTAWAYCHVPNGSDRDMTRAIEDQIERHAPGFRSVILKRSIMTASELEMKNANLAGGDISGGVFNLWKMMLSGKPGAHPYLLSRERGYYMCSSSTPPGPGVHGMCGFNAALHALHEHG